MALSVNTNITSQTVQKNLNKAGDALSTSMTRLSSGLKINSAKDDAAGMQMANRLTSQTKGMTVAIANANNGTSIAQTAEGAMQESTNILQRLRELALQSANGDKSDADRASLQQEFTAKTGELTRIAQTTTYGGRNILDGSFQNQAFQVGADANQTISFGMSDISATGLKGSYSEASVGGAAMTNLAATSMGSVVTNGATTTTTRPLNPTTQPVNTTSPVTTSLATATGSAVPTLTTGGAASTLDAADAITINGNNVVVTTGMKGTALAAAITAADSTVTAAFDDTTGIMTLTSATAINVGGADAAKTGLPATTAATTTTTATATGTAVSTLTTGGGASTLTAADKITINGNNVAVTAGMKGAALAAAITAADSTVTAAFDDTTGVMTLTSASAISVGGADAAKAGIAGTPTATATGAAVSTLTTGGAASTLTAADEITINGNKVAVTAGMKGAALAAAITAADSDVTAAFNDTTGVMTLTSAKAIAVGGADAAKAGLATATATGAAVSTLTTGGAASTLTATDEITVNGNKVAVTAGMKGTALAAAITAADSTVTAAFNDTTGVMTLTSAKAITVGGASAAKAGLVDTGPQATTETSGTPKDGTSLMGGDGSISINGKSVAWTADETVDQVLGKMGAVDGIKSATINAEGRIELKSTDGNDVKLANVSGGSLAKLGLSAGTSQAKLTADTSIELNGVEVKFKKGDTADSIVSSINSASTGVTASKNADGTLKLFSTKDITIKDGSAGTGLEALGLTPAAGSTGTTAATTVETTVSDLSVLTAADSQRTVQALSDAIQQIDTQRSALGAVQNRFTSTVANLQSISENSTAALGRVQDTDFASEAAELTKQQTLQQASTAILSQANQLPSAVMKLLQ